MTVIRKTSNWNAEQNQYVTTVETLGERATLRVYSEIRQIMSDVWESALCAQIWDEKTQSVQMVDWIESGTSDATSEVISKAKSFMYNRFLKRKTDELASRERDEAARIVKESRVKVVSGRTAKGVEGKVVVIIERPYGMGYRANMEKKLAIATSDVKVKVAARNGKVYDNYQDLEWVWARNCERIDVAEVDMESVKERAEKYAEYEVKALGW